MSNRTSSSNIIQQLQKENRELRHQITALIKALPGSIYIKDCEGKYCFVNYHALKMVGLSQESEIIGKTDFDIFPEKDAKNFREIDDAILKHRQEILKEESVVSPDGKILIQLSSKKPYYDTEGKVAGIIGNTIDITYLKETEEKLRKAKIKAESANRAKAEFLANMSHDIKTAISGIIGLAELQMMGCDEVLAKEYANHIYLSGVKVLDFFNNCIELSIADNDHQVIHHKDFSIKDILQSIVLLFTATIRTRPIALDVHIDPDVPEKLFGPDDALYRILLNLVGNAVKFTAEGAITISAALRKNPKNRLVLSVKDTGIGIATKDQTVIFEQFTRLNPAYQGKFEGSGIGLFIVHKLVNMLNGEIHLTSLEGEGSTFTVEIPIQFSKTTSNVTPIHSNMMSQKSKILPIPQTTQLKILLIEDNRIAQHIAEVLLSAKSCIVHLAKSGTEAIKSFIPGKFDLIFTDIGLPDMDGYQIVKKIRELENNTGFTVPILGLTAHATLDSKKIAKNAGIDEMLSKPLTGKVIEEIFNKYVYCVQSVSELSENPLPHLDKVIDFDEVIRIFGKKSVVLEMLREFLKTVDEKLKYLDELYQAKNFHELQIHVHKFHGGICYLCVPRLRQAVARLEDYVSSREIQQVEKYLIKMKTEVEAVKKAFHAQTSEPLS